MKKVVLRFREVDRDKFEAVKSGAKSIETRAATEKFKDIEAGDTIVAVCGDDKTEKKVKEAQHFDSIEDIFAVYDLKQVLPSAKSLEDAYKIYYSFPGYKEKIAQHGLIALVLE